MNKNRLRTTAYDLLTDIQKTRNEAVHRVARVTLWNADNDWDTGWQMFVDDNADGNFDTGETLLFVRDATPTSISISGNSSVASMVSYKPSGESVIASGAFQAGTITLCAEGQDKAFQIVISKGGRARMIKEDRTTAGCS